MDWDGSILLCDDVLIVNTQDLGVLLWSNGAKRFVVVSASGHDEVRRFWRRQSRN